MSSSLAVRQKNYTVVIMMMMDTYYHPLLVFRGTTVLSKRLAAAMYILI